MITRRLWAFDARQASILADRYLDVVLGDFGATALLVLQAPLIGALVAGVWANASRDTLTMYFVLCLSAFFLGAVNSAREIVKERALFERERMFGLSIAAYLVSKMRVLSMLAILQCAILCGVVRFFVPMQINVAIVSVALIATAIAGTAVGLCVSAFVSSSDKAVAAVPLVVIPQILFSDFVLGERQLANWTGWAQKLMPVRWSYDLLAELYGADWQLGDLVLPAVVLVSMIEVMLVISVFLLSRSES